MRDCGTQMKQNEDVRAVLEAVIDTDFDSDLLEELDEDTLRLVRAQAESHNRDECDMGRVGGENV